MAGILATGGSIDHAFDIFRGDIGKADTAIQGWIHDRLNKDSNRYDIQAVLWQYGDGIAAGRHGRFSGYDDPQSVGIVSDIANRTGKDSGEIWDILYALHELKGTDSACASIWNGNGGNIFDDVVNGGVTKGVANAVNNTLDALGLPSLSTVVILLFAVGIILAVIYVKGRK
jgi:uncharacterized protein YukE